MSKPTASDRGRALNIAWDAYYATDPKQRYERLGEHLRKVALASVTEAVKTWKPPKIFWVHAARIVYKDVTEARDKYVNAISERLADALNCEVCKGRGLLMCEDCNGKGCKSCSNEGKVRCFACEEVERG